MSDEGVNGMGWHCLFLFGGPPRTSWGTGASSGNSQPTWALSSERGAWGMVLFEFGVMENI